MVPEAFTESPRTFAFSDISFAALETFSRRSALAHSLSAARESCTAAGAGTSARAACRYASKSSDAEGAVDAAGAVDTEPTSAVTLLLFSCFTCFFSSLFSFFSFPDRTIA